MALRAYVGNRPNFDEDGFVHGALTKVELVTHKEDKGDWESLRWTFEAEGTLRPFAFSEMTGLSIHPPDEKSGEFNKLTTLIVRLGILTVEDVVLPELPDHDLESAVGQLVKFKIYRKDNFYRIDLATLSLESDEA